MSSGSFCASCGSPVAGQFCGSCGAQQGGSNPSAPGSGWWSGTGQPTGPTTPNPTMSNPTPTQQYTNPGGYSTGPGRPAATMVLGPTDFDGDHPRVGSLFLAGWQCLVGNIGDWLQTLAVGIAVLIGIGLLGALSFQTKQPIVILIVLLIAVIAGIYIQYGFCRTALFLARGRKPLISEAWSPDRLVPFVMFHIITPCLLIGSLAVPIVGTVLVLAAVIYAPFFILENRGSGMTGLWMSVRASITNSRLLWQLLLIIFAITVIFSTVGFGYLLGIVGAIVGAGAGSTTGSTSSTAQLAGIGIAIAGFLTICVYIGSVIVTLGAAATAYVHLDAVHEQGTTP